MYRRLTQGLKTPLEGLRIKWETDLGTPIEEKPCELLMERAWKCSRNARFQRIQFYVFHRAYLTPHKINEFFGSHATCPRCRLEGAVCIHMFWDCPLLRGFWGEVLAKLTEVTERDLQTTLGVCLLHWFPHTSRNKTTSKFLDLGLVLAKREITSHWKASTAPSVARWLSDFTKWEDCEGTLRLQLARRTDNNKFWESARACVALVDLQKNPTEDDD